MNSIILVNIALHSLLLSIPGWILVRWVLRDARQRALASVLTMAAAALVPLLITMLPQRTAESLSHPHLLKHTHASIDAGVPSISDVATIVPPEAAPSAAPWHWQDLSNALPWTWLTGTCLLGLLHLALTLKATLWHRRLRPGPFPGVWTFEGVGSPCVAGILRPIVAVPEAAMTGWTQDQWRWLLAHEREHVRGKDPAVAWLLGWVRAYLWWHPLVHDLIDQWSQAREEVCDAAAAAPTNDGIRYAEFLLDVATNHPPCLALPMAASRPVRRLRARLLALMNQRPVCARVSWQFTMGAAILLGTTTFLASSAGFPVRAAPSSSDSLGQQQSTASASEAVVDTTKGIAATVNQKPITRAEVLETATAERQKIRSRYQHNPKQMQKELMDAEKTALDSLIERELVLAEFKKLGGTIKPQYVEDDINAIIREQFKGDREAFSIHLAKEGMTLAKFRELREKMIIVQVMRAKLGGKPPAPTPQEIEDYYNAHAVKWQRRNLLQISTITIPKTSRESSTTASQQKQLAEAVRTQLETGADFADLARKYSQDSHGPDGGKWDWMEGASMSALVAEAAYALSPGACSPVIEDSTSYIIIRLNAVKPGPTVLTLEKVSHEIERLISAERSQAQFRKWLDGAKQKAEIHTTP